MKTNLSEPSDLNILIGCTGSVATIKLPHILQELLDLATKNENKLNIRVVCTEHARHFFKREDLPSGVEVYTDEMEWQGWQQRGDPVLHIELAKWAHLMVIAPLDANTLAKMAQGICDNLLTCIARAWIFPRPLLFCPAMNTRMWEHPITSIHINMLKQWACKEVPCVVKTLMCGDTGYGAMAEVATIIESIRNAIKEIHAKENAFQNE